MTTNVLDMVPPKGFFPRYVRYASDLTDAPEIFHVAAALAMHSAVIANFVEVGFPTRGHGSAVEFLEGDLQALPDGGKSVRMSWSSVQLWVLIVGESGDRKGTAIELARDCARPLIEKRMVELTTPEATFDIVGHHPDAVFCFPEGATFFSMFNASYWKHGQGLFPQLYDGQDMQRELAGLRTKKNPQPEPILINIKRPRVTLVTGIAPSHLDRATEADWEGGLIGRMLPFLGTRSRYEPAGSRCHEPEMLVLREMLQATEASLLKIHGIMRLGMKSAAGDMFAEWGAKLDHVRKTKARKTQAVYNRIPQHTLRVAAHYAVSQRLTAIDVDSMKAAINLGTYCARALDQIGEMLTDDKVVRLTSRVREHLKSIESPAVPLGRLMHDLHVSMHALRGPVESLMAAGEIKLTTAVGSGQRWILKTTPSTNPPK